MTEQQDISVALVICEPCHSDPGLHGPTAPDPSSPDSTNQTPIDLDSLNAPYPGWTEVVAVGGVAAALRTAMTNAVLDQSPGGPGAPPAPERNGLRRPRAIDRWQETDSDYLLFAPADCPVATDAHRSIHELIRHNRTVDFAYFDSTGYQPGEPTRLVESCHRPGFSPERLRAQMYLGQVFLVSRVVAEALADQTDDEDSSPLAAPLSHDTALAIAAASSTIAHLPRVLYRFPSQTNDEAQVASVGSGVACDPAVASDPAVAKTVARHQKRLDHSGFPARAALGVGAQPIVHLEPEFADPPPVSIIMPTNGAQREIDGRPTVLCLQAIDSVIEKTTYPDYELVLVITPGAPPDLATQVISTVDSHPPKRQPTIRFCRDNRPFNFSNACNRGAVNATGEVFVFLNDDTMVDTANWLDRLVMYGSRPDIGAVGARLHYGNGRIQHAGIWTRGGHPSHRYERFAADHPGYLDSLTVPQNCLAVTGACLAVSADKFRRVGGFSPRFPSSYNDVDLCLKLDELGYRTVVDPEIVLTHFESSSRDPKIEDWELAILHERWRSVITNDPYDNPNHLAPGSEEYPAPDPVVTEQKRLAGWIDFHPRIWPRPTLSLDPVEVAATLSAAIPVGGS